MSQLRHCALCAALVLCGCNGSATEDTGTTVTTNAPQPATIVTTSYIIAELTRALMPSDVEVTLIVPEDMRPDTWTPAPEDIRRMQSADCVLVHGLGQEPWLARVSLPRSRLKLITADIPDKRLIREPSTKTHQHGPAGDSSETPVVAHTWLDPELAIVQLDSLQSNLETIYPQHSDRIVAKAAVLRNTLADLDKTLQQLAEHSLLDPTTVFADNSDLSYLLRRIGIPQDKLSERWVDADELASRIAALRDNNGRPLFLHTENVSPELIAQLAADGVEFVSIDLCSQPEPGRTVMERLADNVTRLRSALNDK